MDATKFKAIYVSKELHKRIRMYCLANGIRNMQMFINPILEAAMDKPDAKERLKRQEAEMTPEAYRIIEEEKAEEERRKENEKRRKMREFELKEEPVGDLPDEEEKAERIISELNVV